MPLTSPTLLTSPALLTGVELPVPDSNQPTSDLREYITAIATMFENVEEMVRDGTGNPPWSVLFSIDKTPLAAMDWLAQWVGVRLEEKSASENDITYYARQRDRIRNANGFSRGTVAGIVAAAQAYLTGNKTVIVRERDPDAYSFIVITFTSETPDPNAVNLAVRAQKPASLVLDYHTLSGNDYATVLADDATYALADAHWLSYKGMLEGAPSGGSSSALEPGSATLPGAGTLPSP